MHPSPRFLTEPRIWLNSSPSHEPQAGTGFRQGELSFFWTPWGNLCDAGVRSNSCDPFQDTWREGDEYDVSRYKGKGPFFSEAGPSTLAAVQNDSEHLPLRPLMMVQRSKTFPQKCSRMALAAWHNSSSGSRLRAINSSLEQEPPPSTLERRDDVKLMRERLTPAPFTSRSEWRRRRIVEPSFPFSYSATCSGAL